MTGAWGMGHGTWGEKGIPSPESRIPAYFPIVTFQVPCWTASRGVKTIRLR